MVSGELLWDLSESLWGNGKSMGNLLSDSCWGIDVGKYGILVRNLWPRCSMYGIFTYICPKNCPNVGKYNHTWSIWVVKMPEYLWFGDSYGQDQDHLEISESIVRNLLARDSSWSNHEQKRPSKTISSFLNSEAGAGPFDAFCGSVEDGSLMEMIPIGSRIPTQQLTPWHKTWEKSWEFNSSK